MSETIGQKWDKASKATRGKINPNLTPDDSPKATQAVLNLMHARSQAEGVKGSAKKTQTTDSEVEPDGRDSRPRQ